MENGVFVCGEQLHNEWSNVKGSIGGIRSNRAYYKNTQCSFVLFYFICCAQAFKAIQLKRWWTSLFVSDFIQWKQKEEKNLEQKERDGKRRRSDSKNMFRQCWFLYMHTSLLAAVVIVHAAMSKLSWTIKTKISIEVSIAISPKSYLF